MDKNRRYYTDANRAAWEEVAPLHAEQNLERLSRKFAQPGYSSLPQHCETRLREIGVTGKSVAQICCNNGQDLLSVKNLGAGRCVGFDAAATFIEQARHLARVAGHDDVDFQVTDLYEIPTHHSEVYDLVLSTIGVLGWMPDLPAYFDVVTRLTKPGGHYFMEEMHPVLLMYEPGEDGAPSYLAYSYFEREPLEDTQGLDYYGSGSYQAKPNYSFQHTLSDIVMAGIDHGLRLLHFDELDYDISLYCTDLESVDVKPPLGMTMVWHKPD